jgi:hypothetical protein
MKTSPIRTFRVYQELVASEDKRRPGNASTTAAIPPTEISFTVSTSNRAPMMLSIVILWA